MGDSWSQDDPTKIPTLIGEDGTRKSVKRIEGQNPCECGAVCFSRLILDDDSVVVLNTSCPHCGRDLPKPDGK